MRLRCTAAATTAAAAPAPPAQSSEPQTVTHQPTPMPQAEGSNIRVIGVCQPEALPAQFLIIMCQTMHVCRCLAGSTGNQISMLLCAWGTAGSRHKQN